MKEIDSTIFEGHSLRARLTKDKGINQHTPGCIVMGRVYYNHLRVGYQSTTHPNKQLVVTNPDAEVRHELFQAMLASKKVPAQRQPMLQLLQNMTKIPNQSEVVGILRWCVDLRPTASSEQYQGVIQTMRWWVRLGLDKLFPAETKVCLAAFEQGLLQAIVIYHSIHYEGLICACMHACMHTCMQACNHAGNYLSRGVGRESVAMQVCNRYVGMCICRYACGYHYVIWVVMFLYTPQAYKNTRGLEEGPNEFLTKFADIWGLVLPIAETKTIQAIDCDQKFNEFQDEVRTVCSSGPLGSACFTFALKLINADLVQDTIGDIVDKMLLKKTLGEEDRVLVLLSPPLNHISG